MKKIIRLKIILVILVLGVKTYGFSQGGEAYTVGTPKATFNVDNSGAATYQISIEAPNGGKVTPQIGVAYNSQSGNGLVGYGCNITGITSITRGSKDLFHDGIQKGSSYSADDAYYLNGMRLILQSGTAGIEGAVYTPEGEPYTKVIVHGNCSTSSCWFEVKSSDGVVCQYGKSSDSRLVYSNRRTAIHVAAWYINRVENQYTDYATYNYSTSENLCIRPTSINYGTNNTKSRGISNSISFSYASLGANSVPFTLEDRQGKTDMKLIGIRTSAGAQTYRQYDFTYNDNGDGSHFKYSRLIQIDEKNGVGEALRPIKLVWNYLPSSNLTPSTLDVQTDINLPSVEETSKNFFAVDVNNDGISDILRITPANFSSRGYTTYNTYLSVSLSQKGKDGKVTYKSPEYITLGPTMNLDGMEAIIGGIQAMDFDGDGYNDIIIPEYGEVGPIRNECFYLLLGKDLAAGSVNLWSINTSLIATHENPLFTTFDINGDGKDDLFYIEKNSKDNIYNGEIISSAGGRKVHITSIGFKFDHDPQKLFSADFNGDGLNDLIFFYDGGYKIYFNNGGDSSNVRFSESNVKTSSDLGNCFRIEQGDFDGDGRMDFLYYIEGNDFNIAFNNGDGTFALNPKAFTLDDLSNQDTSKDDDKFTILVYDIDHDGKSDIVISKAQYFHHGGFRGRNSLKCTIVKWIYSGINNTYSIAKTINTGHAEDAEPQYLFIGDFDGDGAVELANYGTELYTGDDSKRDIIHVYRTGSDIMDKGKVSSIIDGLGKTTTISYNTGTDPNVYSPTNDGKYPVNSYTLPLSLVSQVNIDNGAAGRQNIEYKYGGLKIHIAGKGLLGFTKISAVNTTVGSKDETEITKWDENKWIPLEAKTTSIMGSDSSTVLSSYNVSDVGVKNYFSYVSDKNITDYDGNVAEVSTVYDTVKGVPTQELVRNGGSDMYKQVNYAGYITKAGMWMPSSVEKIQKHKDDSKLFSLKTSYTYDDKGNILTIIKNDGTSLPLKTTNTYDVYGNILTTVSSGAGVGENIKTNIYDNSGRYVVKATESATSAVNTFTYDLWGNVLTENDITNPQFVLTTKHVYDGWGTETSETEPTGDVTTTSIGWGISNKKKYFVLKSPDNSAWEKIWYDDCGHEVLTESMGPMHTAISKMTSYDEKGQISRISNTTGKLTTTETFAYDGRGRVMSDVLSSGKTTTYSYGNHTMTSAIAGKNYTKTTDAWGNILKSTDPVSEVDYTYASCGKPSFVSTNGATTAFEYDDAGNQISMNDPDAGKSVYTYSADGKILTETDARGIKTTNTYDNKGRLVSSQIGNSTIVNTYGTTGNEANRLVKSTCGKNSIEYAHDVYGRAITEKRNVDGYGIYAFEYVYNTKNQLLQTKYPGGLIVSYTYDEFGNKIQTKAGDDIVYKLENYDGLSSLSTFKGLLACTHTLDSRGFETNIKLTSGTNVLEDFNENYDGATGNLFSRQQNDKVQESFGYDNLDRLVSVKSGENTIMNTDYAANGNISYKTDIGPYTYDKDIRPHAVNLLGNIDGKIPNGRLITTYNDLNKINRIIYASTGSLYLMSVGYGPDEQRWTSLLQKNGKDVRSTVYAGDCEEISENGAVWDFYYLDGNTIVIRQANDYNAKFKSYQAFCDNLGSILSVVDEAGHKVFDASYDAWGKQTVIMNTIGLHRGYCGHEMLNEFNIINMNGRLYDPVIGRFLSPDNFVQQPDNSQNFNRYSYCLNNPLKYTDPSGNLFGIDDAVIAFAAFNMANSMMQASCNGENIWKAGAISLLSSAASYGIGSVFKDVGNFGHELLRAGAHGLASGVVAALDGDNFVSGFISGASASGLGSYAQNEDMNIGLMVASTTTMGGIVAWTTGGDFLQGAMQGLNIGALNFAEHDITYYHDSQGHIYGDIDEVVVYANSKAKACIQLAGIYSNASTGISVLRGINKYAGKCRVGTNGKLYLPKAHGQFYGNQFVKTRLLKSLNHLGLVSRLFTTGEDFANLSASYIADGNKIGVNCERYIAKVIGRELGSWGGHYIGSMAGFAVGTGVASVPLSIAGSVAGDYFGGEAGSALGEFVFDAFIK